MENTPNKKGTVVFYLKLILAVLLAGGVCVTTLFLNELVPQIEEVRGVVFVLSLFAATVNWVFLLLCKYFYSETGEEHNYTCFGVGIILILGLGIFVEFMKISIGYWLEDVLSIRFFPVLFGGLLFMSFTFLIKNKKF